MDRTQNARRPSGAPAFEVTDTEVIIRPWETTLTLPVPQGPLKWQNPVPHTLMGIECLVSRTYHGARNMGFSLLFPRTRVVISIDVLPGEGVNLVDLYITNYRDDASRGLARHTPLPRFVCDDRVLLALIQAAADEDPAEESVSYPSA